MRDLHPLEKLALDCLGYSHLFKGLYARILEDPATAMPFVLKNLKLIEEGLQEIIATNGSPSDQKMQDITKRGWLLLEEEGIIP